jgi:chromosome segregation ATPase
LENIEELMGSINREVEDTETRQKELQKIQGEVGTAQSSITVAQRLVQKYQGEMADLLSNSTSVDSERSKLKVISKDIVARDKERKEVVIQQEYNEATASLLKDTGIKTKIIKQYVPVFNKLINTYLSHLDLFVSFELDENFNETVKSRYRDSFTYESFSEGEKQRIDLAMLFTFREIARMKNAINVNLLIMDEVLDQSLDGIGVENFFNIIGSLSSTNLFVISHRENMGDKFDSHLKLYKRNNFTEVDIN